MSAWLIALTGIMYAGVAVDQYVKGAGAMSIVYVGYALANVGMYALAR